VAGDTLGCWLGLIREGDEGILYRAAIVRAAVRAPGVSRPDDRDAAVLI
jgi:hypothetical protein